MSQTLKQLQEDVQVVGAKFPYKWNLQTFTVDLIEEVGELANAVLVETGSKSPKRRRADLQDSFADVLFVLLMMADEAGVDIEDALQTMLKEVRVRQNNGEYEGEKKE